MRELLLGLLVVTSCPLVRGAEIYPAVDSTAIDVTMVSVPQAVLPNPAADPVKTPRKPGKPSQLPRNAKTDPRKVTELPRTPEAVQVTAGDRFSFDPVPQAHAESVAGRLAIVADLIRRHGRAYDYRALTTQELETIRGELDRADGAGPPPETEADSNDH